MHSMIQLCCLVPFYLATVPIFPGIHIWLKSVKISCFQIFLCSSLSNPAPAFLVLSFQIYRVWELKYIGSFLFWSLKVIFFPVLLSFQIYSPLNLTLPMEEPGRTRLSDFTFTFHFHALEKEMATHSSVLTWRIPGTGEPGGLSSLRSHRVRHDWSDLAAAAAAYLVFCAVWNSTRAEICL